tara:strand:- start:86910 stop:87683 length:774 start_codon:yes stop_codon:yes gene_type:complete
MRACVLCALILGVFTGLAWLSWLSDFTIERIEVVGNTTVPEEDVRAYIGKRLTGGYLSVFSRANVLLFQPRVVETELLERFKKIKDINVSRDSLHSIVVEIDERKPYYLWCIAPVSPDTRETCFFLDINGLAFAPAPYFSGHVYFEFHKQLGDAVDPVGMHFMPEEEFKRIISFRNSMRAFELEPHALIVDERGDYLFLLPSGAKMIFNTEQDFDLLFSNLLATFDTEQFKGRKSVEHTSLEYIDLRFKNKVYYRFK